MRKIILLFIFVLSDSNMNDRKIKFFYFLWKAEKEASRNGGASQLCRDSLTRQNSLIIKRLGGDKTKTHANERWIWAQNMGGNSKISTYVNLHWLPSLYICVNDLEIKLSQNIWLLLKALVTNSESVSSH